MAEWNKDITDQITLASQVGFATNELPVDMSSKTWSAFPEVTPLTAILSRAKDSKSQNYRYDWQEVGQMPTQVQVGATLAAAGTALTIVANATTLVTGTILFNPRTMDAARVTTTPTTSAVTVTRDYGGTTGAIWNTLDVLEVMPPQLPENYATSAPVSVADTNEYNYIQLIRMSYQISRIADRLTTHFGGPGSKRASLKAQKYVEFRKKWEKLLYFGGRSSTGTAPASAYGMGGLTHFLYNGTLFKDFNGIMTQSGLRRYLRDFKDQNPDVTNVMGFMSGNVRDHISDFGLNSIQVSPRAEEYGLDIRRYIGAVTLDMVELPLLVGPELQGWGWILDMDRIELANFDPPSFYGDANNVGQSELILDTYRVVTGMRLANESRHTMFVNAKL